MIFSPPETITSHVVIFTADEFELILKREHGLARKGKFNDLLINWMTKSFPEIHGRPIMDYTEQSINFQIKHGDRDINLSMLYGRIEYAIESYIRYAKMMKNRVPRSSALTS